MLSSLILSSRICTWGAGILLCAVSLLTSQYREALAATAKTGELNAQVAELKIAVEKAETLKKQVEAQAEALREEVADATMSLKRLERKVWNHPNPFLTWCYGASMTCSGVHALVLLFVRLGSY